MPNIKSAKKELRKSHRKLIRNTKVRVEIKTLAKDAKKALTTGAKEAKEAVIKTMKALDKAARKGVIKKNTANRKKSRLHKKLNKLSSVKK